MRKEIVGYDPPRPYARGARVGDLIFLAGEVGDVTLPPGQEGQESTRQIVAGGIVPQAERAFENIRASLEAFGAGLDDIVKMTVYLVSPEDQRSFQEVRRRYLSYPVPSTMVWVKRLGLAEMLVEVDVIAVAPAGA